MREAGIKIDLVAAHGIGAGAALLTAVDGAAALWEPGGLWRDPRVRSLYGLTPPLVAVRLAVILGCALVIVPPVLLAAGLLAYPLGLLVQLVSPTVGQELIARYAALVGRAFEPAMLPTILPRLALFTLIVIVLIVAGAALRAPTRSHRVFVGQRSASVWVAETVAAIGVRGGGGRLAPPGTRANQPTCFAKRSGSFCGVRPP